MAIVLLLEKSVITIAFMTVSIPVLTVFTAGKTTDGCNCGWNYDCNCD